MSDVTKAASVVVPLEDGSTCVLPVGAYVKGYAASHKQPRRCEIVGVTDAGQVVAWEICRSRGSDILTRGAREPYVGFIALGAAGAPADAHASAPRLGSDAVYPSFHPDSESHSAYRGRVGGR